MNGFSYWIFGYQKFAEPIIRECICLNKGWVDIFKTVKTPSIDVLVGNLEKREDWDSNYLPLKQEALKELKKRKKSMVLDAAFQDSDGNVIIGEFKSWGGFEKYRPEKLYNEITCGRLFPDRIAIDQVHVNGVPTKVSRFIIATSLTSQNDHEIIWRIGNVVVEVVDISLLLKKHGTAAAQARKSLEQLEKAVEYVKGFIATGNDRKQLKPEKLNLKSTELKSDGQVQMFIDDNHGYLEWAKKNQHGYIVNCKREPDVGYLILHKSTCYTVSKATKGPGNWTNGDYIKVCSLDKKTLSEWARTELGGELQPCGTCKP